jgi:preprotein translocase subunit YajC
MSFFLSNALAEGTVMAGQNDPLALLLPIGLVVILYVFMIHPQVKRQKLHKIMIDALEKGDEIVTSGGLVGRIMDLGDNFAVMEIAPNVQIKIRRAAVETVLPKGSLKEL